MYNLNFYLERLCSDPCNGSLKTSIGSMMRKKTLFLASELFNSDDFMKIKSFKRKHGYLVNTWSTKAVMGTVVNRK